jgi:spore germination protein KA
MQEKILKRLQEEFSKNSDLVIKNIKTKSFKDIYIIYLESVTGSDKVNDYILKKLTSINNLKNVKKNNIESIIPGPNTIKIDNPDKIEFYLTNGFTIVLSKKEILAFETKADINRSVSVPEVQKSIYGPKDAFTENIQINLGLLKRRIKSSHLKSDDLNMGRVTNTNVKILYIDNITDYNLVLKVKEKLQSIDLDGIVDSGNIAQILTEDEKTPFPTIASSERPDVCSDALLEGKICIMVDTSPFVLILPSFFADFINPNVDNYNRHINVNFLKILRFFSFFLTMIVPGFYVALVTYNMETIPTSLLVNFASQNDGVPFPTIIEAMVMIIVCEILRESDLRFPSSYGSAISILGALVLGEAAVSAGIVSPIMIIIIAFTFITSLIFTELELINAIRYFRFVFLIFAALYGLYGIALSFIYFLIHINNVKTIGKPYFYPISPFDKTYIKKTLFRSKFSNDTKRSKEITNKNIIKKAGFIK